MKNFDLNNLDFNNAGAWPVPVKAFFATLIVIIILFLGWYSFVSNQQNQLEQLQRTEQDLRRDFEAKQAKAVNLEPLTAHQSGTADGTVERNGGDVAANVAAVAQQDRDAGLDRRHLPNCFGIRYPE